ncbi:MAG TPA: hypothetical protein EYG70_03775 [Sulfurimonas sp.]|nr:hypothetical protein [Sulfurimonas sp.]
MKKLYPETRQKIRSYTNDVEININILNGVGIDITKDGFFKVRPDERTPSCKIYKDGSFHDFGSGEHYSDIVSLFYDGYHAFNSLPETMEWLCQELNIQWEVM